MTKLLFFLFLFILITPKNSQSSQFYIPKPRSQAPAPIQAPPPTLNRIPPPPSTPVPTPPPSPTEQVVAPPAQEEHKITPKIVNETSFNGERKYTPLFSFTNSQLKNEAMIFYAKLDPKTGEIDKYNPIVWRRVDKDGKIIVPKTMQTKKIELLFSPGTYVDSNTLKFTLNFQLYKPDTKHSDAGADVLRELIIKKENGEYEAYLTRGNIPVVALKEIHSHIHFRHLGKAIIGNPEGTNAYWVRITAEDNTREYIVPNNYKKHLKSMPQKSDPTYSRSISRIVNPHGIEVQNY